MLGTRMAARDAPIHGMTCPFNDEQTTSGEMLARPVTLERLVIYRMRGYRTVPEKAPAFHDFFNQWLLPIQLRGDESAPRLVNELIGKWLLDN